jgi:uroporphyrinogen decarboxylase
MSTLTSKLRVRRMLEGKDIDRVPFGTSATKGATIARLCKALSASDELSAYDALGIDVVHLRQPLQYIGPQRTFQGMPADFWGVPLANRGYGHREAVCPLSEIESVDEVERYPWPDIVDFSPIGFEEKLTDMARFHIDGYLWAPFFHDLIWLCGFEKAMIDMIERPEVTWALINRIVDFWVSYARKTLEFAKGRLDSVSNCNDFGTQRGLLFSRDLFLRFFLPGAKRLYDVAKEYETVPMQHSCGDVSLILDDLIGAGAGIINPVQTSADHMDIAGIAGRFRSKAVFYGGIDTQWVLPNGDEAIIRAHVRGAVEAFSGGRGYILGPSQQFGADIPIESILAMYDEGRMHF